MTMNSIVVTVLCFVAYLGLALGSTVSYSSPGHWDVNNRHPELCDKYMCTSGKKSFIPNDPDFVYYDNNTACAKLIEKGISLITFYGDSYQRQLYAGLLITLKGDYQYGSLADHSKNPTCEYHKQFYEKKCGVLQLNHYGSVCGGKILLDPLLTGIDNLNGCLGRKGALLIWSFGNHRLGPNRYGVNNATAYSKHFGDGVCKDIHKNAEEIDGSYDKPCSIWWASTHFRRIGWFPDEKEDVVKDYNVGMRHFFDSKSCGNVNYVDMYNMTMALVKEAPEEAEHMTYDSVHWGLEVNLVKAQILLNAILRGKTQQ